MKIAVITPHWHTHTDYLRRNLESVATQETEHYVHHFLIADGYECPEQDALIKTFPRATHLQLPCDCDDVGATPAVMATYMALALGYEGFVFLGDDNVLTPDHVESCVAAHIQSNAPVVYSKRFFMTQEGVPLGMPDEKDHVDANCIVLFGEALRYVHLMARVPRPLLQVNDRVFWRAMTSRFPTVGTGKRTVGYATRWASHYRFLGLPVPPGAKENTGQDAERWFTTTPEDEKQGWLEYIWGK